jgi:hypothetical protein
MTKDDFINSIEIYQIDFLSGLKEIDDPLAADLGTINDHDIHRHDDIVPETLFERISLFSQEQGDRWACVKFQVGKQELCVWTASRDCKSMFIAYEFDHAEGMWRPLPIMVISDGNDIRYKQTSLHLSVALPLSNEMRETVMGITMLPVALAEGKTS